MTTPGVPVVLFVDDEDEVLAGIRSGLRRQRRSYDFNFAVGAEEAYEILDSTEVDIVVTDMRMPGINGVELLRRVRRHDPTVVRLVLSGEAEEELVIESVALAHRWLSKPCDREELAAALADAVVHRELLAAPIDGPIGVDPPLFAAVLQAMATPATAPAAVADLIRSRPDVRSLIERWSCEGSSEPVSVRNGVAPCGLTRIMAKHGLGRVAQVVLLAELFADGSAWFRRTGVSPETVALNGHPEADSADRLSAWFAAVLRDTADLAGHPLGARLLAQWGLPTDLVIGVLEHQSPPAVGEAGPTIAHTDVAVVGEPRRLVARERIAS